MTTEWEAYVKRAQAKYGERLDLSDIDPELVRYFHGPRIRVQYVNDPDETIAGVVSVTTGWKPALLLVRRKSDLGSSDTLHPGRWRVTAVKRGRAYVDVTS